MLEIRGLGLSLPPARKIRELVAEAGGDPSAHEGWEQICLAGPDDHPSTLASTALAEALNEAGISASQLALVIAVGVSRDYPASWSVAAEVMKLSGAAPSCIGFDLTIGCLGSLVGLVTARGWLEQMGGGYAAIVTGERWTQTVDRTNPAEQPLWGHADGGGAIVVSLGDPSPPRAVFHGARFSSHAAFNGVVLVKYGGTRFPVAPPGVSPSTRALSGLPKSELWSQYEAGYGRVFAALREMFPDPTDRLICNQISPNIVRMIGRVAGVSDDRICRTGDDYGHVGAADLIVGLRRLIDHGQLDGPVALAASVPYAFGAGIVTPARPR